MRLFHRQSLASHSLTLLLAVVMAAPSVGAELQWVGHRRASQQPEQDSQPESAPPAGKVQQAAFTDLRAVRKNTVRRVAKQPTTATPKVSIRKIAKQPVAKQPVAKQPVAVRATAAATEPQPAAEPASLPSQTAAVAIEPVDPTIDGLVVPTGEVAVAAAVANAFSGAGGVEHAAHVGACTDGACADGACADGSCTDGACTDGSCSSGGCGCGGVIVEPGCGCVEPGCGCAVGCGDFVEPGCGCAVGCGDFVEPGCSYESGGCGCGDAACGGCGQEISVGFGASDATKVCIYLPPIKNFVVFGGVQGFKNPLDAFRDRGNFGFNQGFNFGGKMSWLPIEGLGYQFGFRATQNQLSGTQFNSATGVPVGDSETHSQSFLTTGLFRRTKSGLQLGLAYDWLNDERIQSANFEQVRGQISLVNPKGGELGFLFTAGTNEEILNIAPPGAVVANFQRFAAADQFLGFYRFQSHGGGEFRLLLGADSDSRGILGADMLAPLNPSWSINTGFRYLIAEDGAAGIGSTQEGWNLGIDLVYHFHGTARKWHKGRYRPLFRVADNGSLSVAQF